MKLTFFYMRHNKKRSCSHPIRHMYSEFKWCNKKTALHQI